MTRVVAVVHLPHLALTCLPSVRAPSVVVVDDERSEKGESFTLRNVHRIIDADVALGLQGVRPAQRVIDAQRLVPGLAVAVVRRSRLHQELLSLCELMLRHSPCVEPLPPMSIALDLTGMTQPTPTLLLAIERDLLQAGQAGVVVVGSPGKRLSLVLARHLSTLANAPSRVQVNASQAERALAKVGIESLGLDVDVAESLLSLGVGSVSDLKRLVPAGAAAHLFQQARSVLRLLALVDDPLTPLRPPEHIHEDVDVDDAIVTLEPLGFVLRPLCERVCRRALARDTQVAGVVLTLSGRHLPPFAVSQEFPAPLVQARALWSALMVRLEVTGVPGPVERLNLRVSRLVDGRRRQHDAFREPDATPHALSALMAELRAEHGDDVAGCLQISRALLPERMCTLSVPLPSSSMDPGADGRFLVRWPWPVRLLQVPVVVDGSLVVERLRFCRLEGEDGDGIPFSRDYWQVQLPDLRRALTFTDRETEEEWLQGWFD